MDHNAILQVIADEAEWAVAQGAKWELQEMLQSVSHVCMLGEVKGHRSAPNNLGNTVLLHLLKELDKLCSYYLCHHSAQKSFFRFEIGCHGTYQT